MFNTLDCFYGWDLYRDMKEYSRMMKKVEAIKKNMGDHYLLAKPIPKKDLTKEKQNG